MARTNLSLRGSTYWWRRQITVDGHVIPLAISLGTGNFNHACLIGTYLSSAVNDLRMAYGKLGAAIEPHTLKKIFSDAMRWQLGRIMSDQVASPFHGNEHLPANKVYGQLWRHLAEDKGELTDQDREFLSGEGWSESLIDRLGIELEKHRGRRLVSGRQMEAYRDAFGIELTSHNRQILQRTILIARANANDEATRRLLAGDLNPENWTTDCFDETGFAFEAGHAEAGSDKATGVASDDGESQYPIGETSVWSPEVPTPRGRSCLLFIDAAEQCIEAHIAAKLWSPDTVEQVRAATRLFDFASGGEAYVDALTQQDVTNFYALCRAMPNRWGRTKDEIARGLPASLEYAEKLRARGDGHRVGIGAATISKHITWIGKILEFADDEGSEEGCRPARPLRLRPQKETLAAKAKAKKTRDRDKRANWTKAELARLLSATPFHGCKSFGDPFEAGDRVYHGAFYWISLMVVLYGGRSAEFGGLPKAHIFEDAPIPYIQIDYTEIRALKNKQSIRKLPMHPELIRLGFLQYVREMRRSETQHDLLFPELYSPGQTFSKTYYRLFLHWRSWAFPNGTAWKHEVGGIIKDKDVHSFRGAASTAMAGEDEEVILDILGHEGKTTKKKVYDDEADLCLKLKALEGQSQLTSHLKAYDLRIPTTEEVEAAHQRGRPKKRT